MVGAPAAGGKRVVYDVTVTVMGIIHGLMGVSWLGIHVMNGMFVVPEISKAQKLADAPSLRNMKKLSMVGMVLGILTLLTGVVFIFVKWGFDFGRFTEPEPRTVIIALVLVLVVLSMGMAFMRPLGMKVGKAAASLKPMDDLPADFKADLQRLALLGRVGGALVMLAFIMMILAINGGI